MSDVFSASFKSHLDLLSIVSNDQTYRNAVDAAIDAIIAAYRSNKKILIAGNGGSAADAQHMAAEFVSRYRYDRPGLSAFSLCVDPSAVTAIGNDYGYKSVFRRQLESHARQGDVFIGVSTSGKSENVLDAISICKDLGILAIGMTGSTSFDKADISISIPSDDTPRIQEMHILTMHIICECVELKMFPNI